MKNPHGVEPTRFTKTEDYECALFCYPFFGPSFYGYGDCEITIDYKWNEENSCSISSEDVPQYAYPSKYKKSLFVNTAGPDEDNYFTVLDYEVFTHL